tara:strand:+ start:184 stop:603 length:420 start_codon:yes stop_codon:yes gene_type:complete
MNYKIVARYIKDLKFEIPNTKTFFLLEKDISNYKLKIDIKSNQFKEKLIEVEITLALASAEKNIDKINTKIIYSTLIEIEGDLSKKKSLEEIILIKIPTEVYPEIRNLFIFLFKKSGFDKIKIEENINFRSLHEKRSIQ